MASALQTLPPKMVLLRIPARANTLAGFRAWVKSPEFPEHLKVTYLCRDIFLDMSQEGLDTHAGVKAEVCRVLLPLNHKLDRGKFYLDGVLITNEEAAVSNNPDGAAFSWESLDTGRVRLVPREKDERRFLEIEGSPDWVLEIVSDSSVQKDTQDLRVAYHRARIGEYWLIDARGPTISFQILQWRKSGYVPAGGNEDWQRSRFFGRSFRLVRKLGRGGLWQYTLQVKKA